MEISGGIGDCFINPILQAKKEDRLKPKGKMRTGFLSCLDVKPVVYSEATEEMLMFIQIDMFTTADETSYIFATVNEWVPVSDHDGTII